MSFNRTEFPKNDWAEQVRAENERLTEADGDDYSCDHEPRHEMHRCYGTERYDCNTFCTEGDD